MEYLIDAISGIASGGILGAVGALIGFAGKYFQEQQRQAWEEKKWDNEAVMLRLNMEARLAETENELKIVLGQADADQRVASYGLDMTTPGGVHKWVNDVRSLFRPFLTIFLWVVALFIVWRMSDWVGDGLVTVDASVGLIDYVIKSVIFSASTATVWWFGDRALSPPGMKGR